MQMHVVHLDPDFLNEPDGMKFSHRLQQNPQRLGNPTDENFSPVPRHPDNVILLRLVNHVCGLVELHRLPAYRRTPDLAHTPALPGGDLSLN